MMLNNKGFDLWSDQYDKSVDLCEEVDEYPFAGYRDVLNTIYNRVKQGSGNKILDIGFGTGILTKRLYDDGFTIFGIDFSEKMIEIAQGKMPGALLIQHDFSQGIPEKWEDERFDYIVCTYAIHHLDEEQKVHLLKQLFKVLSPGGMVLIGDVGFETASDLAQCKAQNENGWDEEEIYPVLEVLKPSFPAMTFEKISFCAGVFSLTK